MATIILGTIGTAVGGPVGGFIGASIGSLLDNALFGPGTTRIAAPKLDDLNLSLSKEGTPMPFVLGPAVRVGGVLAWKGPLEVVSTSSGGGGGKGGGGVEVEKKTAYTDLRVHFSETLDAGIVDVQKVWFNEKVVYEVEGAGGFDGDYTSSSIGFWAIGYTRGINPTYMQGGQTVSRRGGKLVRVVSWDPAVDLTEYKVNERVAITGATRPELNHPGGAGESSSVINHVGSDTGTNPITLVADEPYTWIEVVHTQGQDYPIGPINGGSRWEAHLEGSITITREQGIQEKSYYDDLALYRGGLAQTTPDGLMEEVEGAGEVPGYINIAGATFDRIDLTDFGNYLPRPNALIKERETLTCGDAIEVMLERSELSTSLFDASACTGNLLGLNTSGPVAIKDVIKPLGIVFDIVVREEEGVYKFEPRSSTVDETVVQDDLGAGQPGRNRTRGVRRSRPKSRRRPDEVVINFFDPERDYQTGSRRIRKINSKRREVLTLDMPFTMSNDLAGEVIDRVLWRAWTDIDEISFSLGPKYLHLRPGDLVNVPDEDGELIAVRISDINIGINFVLNIRGIAEDNLSLSPVSDTDPSGTDDGTVQQVYNMDPTIWNGPALSEDQLNLVGFYSALTNLVLDSSFKNSFLFSDKGQTGTFTSTGVLHNKEAIAGTVIGTVDAGAIGRWDNSTAIVVELTNGILTSSTEEEVLAGANRAMIGDELIGFTQVTSFGFAQYELRGLLRGLRDTETEMNDQAATDDLRFVLLEDTTIQFHSVPQSDMGAVYDFKGVPSGEDEADFLTTTTDTHTLRNLRPFAVSDITVERSGSNATVSWIRRSRAFYPLFVEGGMPRWDPDEVYQVETLDAPGGNVLTTTTVTDATELLFKGAADPLYVRIARVSAQYGVGPTTEATL